MVGFQRCGAARRLAPRALPVALTRTYFIGAGGIDSQMAPSARGSPSGLRSFLERIDAAVDAALNRQFDPTKPVTAAETTKRAGRFAARRISRAGSSAGRASKRLAKLQRRGLKYVAAITAGAKGKSPVRKIVAHPRLIVASCVLVALILSAPAVYLFGAPSLGIKSGMRADLEVFLPPDDPATQILHKIRENYSTEIMIAVFDLYI